MKALVHISDKWSKERKTGKTWCVALCVLCIDKDVKVCLQRCSQYHLSLLGHLFHYGVLSVEEGVQSSEYNRNLSELIQSRASLPNKKVHRLESLLLTCSHTLYGIFLC